MVHEGRFPMARDTTGGLRWHLRAFLRRRHWRLTTDLIADWLDRTQPRHDELLLIGGSAGWMMSGRWLQRFRRVVLVDIDPHAARLFRFNHARALQQSGTQFQAVQLDAMHALETLLAEHPAASVFFDNVLGQQVYRVPALDLAERALERMAERLAGRDWGSVHDLFSGPVEPGRRPSEPQMSFVAMNSPQGMTVDGLTGTPLHKRLLAQVGGSGEWMDHLTSNVFPSGAQTRLIAWPFLPHYAHWLQAGWVPPDDPKGLKC